MQESVPSSQHVLLLLSACLSRLFVCIRTYRYIKKVPFYDELPSGTGVPVLCFPRQQRIARVTRMPPRELVPQLLFYRTIPVVQAICPPSCWSWHTAGVRLCATCRKYSLVSASCAISCLDTQTNALSFIRQSSSSTRWLAAQMCPMPPCLLVTSFAARIESPLRGMSSGYRSCHPPPP